MPRRRTDANIGRRSSVAKLTPYTIDAKKNPSCGGAGSVSVKTQKRCRRIRTGPNHTALKTRLQTERVSAEKQPQHLPPKKRPTVLIRRAPRVLLFAEARSEGAP